MDLPAIAASAAGVVATFLQSAAAQVGSTAALNAGEALHRLVAVKLRQTEHGTNLINRLEQQPTDVHAQQAIAEELTSSARADTGFADQLRAGVEAAASASQGAIGPGSTSIADMQITFGGAMTASHTVFAGAGAQVTQTRSLKVGTGGLVAIVVGVALWLGGVTTAAVVATDAVSESPEEVVESFLDAAATGQPEEAIKYLCYEGRRNAETDTRRGDTSDVVDSYRGWEAADPQFRFSTESEAKTTATVRVDVSAIGWQAGDGGVALRPYQREGRLEGLRRPRMTTLGSYVDGAAPSASRQGGPLRKSERKVLYEDTARPPPSVSAHGHYSFQLPALGGERPPLRDPDAGDDT